MKKIITLSVLLTLHSITLTSSSPQQRETYQRYTDIQKGQQNTEPMTQAQKAQFLLDQANYIKQVFTSANPQPLTLPSQLVGIIQQIVELAQMSAQMTPLEIAYAQIEQGFMGLELQQVMGNRSTFIAYFQKYISDIQKMMSVDMQLESLTHAIKNESDFSKATTYFNTTVLPQRLSVNTQLTNLQNMFQEANPQFQKKQAQLQQLTATVNDWIEALMQTASPEKKQQVKDATNSAVKTVTVSPQVTRTENTEK